MVLERARKELERGKEGRARASKLSKGNLTLAGHAGTGKGNLRHKPTRDPLYSLLIASSLIGRPKRSIYRLTCARANEGRVLIT